MSQAAWGRSGQMKVMSAAVPSGVAASVPRLGARARAVPMVASVVWVRGLGERVPAAHRLALAGLQVHRHPVMRGPVSELEWVARLARVGQGLPVARLPPPAMRLDWAGSAPASAGWE